MALRKSLERYGLATVAAAAATAATVNGPLLLQRRPYMLSFLAVVLSAWFGDFRSALYCAALSLASVAAARTLLLDVGLRWIDIVQAGAFVAVAFVVATVARSRARADTEARHQNAQLEAIFGQAAVGIAIIDQAGRISRANQRMAEIIGRDIKTTVGLPCQSVIHPDDWEAHRERINKVMTGELPDLSMDVRHLCPDAGQIWTHVSLSPLRGADASSGLIAVVLDITERRQAEEALRLADRQKDDFLALLSHELRNPLAPIRTAVQLLQMRGAADDDARRLHGVIERQVQHLVRLVDDLLDVSRILRDKVALRPAPVNIADVVALAVETVRPLVDAQRQELTVALPTEPLHVHGDQVRLAQALGNLLNNASKYTPRGGAIILSVRALDDTVTLAVSDSGSGIPAEVLPTIFEPFVQADRSLQRAQGGLGIGLTLVKKIVELHGGTVDARSGGSGEGSEFTVRLPQLRVAEPPPAAAAPAPAAADDLPRLRVLVVDDNIDAADSLSMLLTSMGHDVAISRDGIDAVRRAWQWRPDVVLLDIGLPGMSGYEVAQALSEREPRPRIIAVTGYGQDADRERAREAGFDAHLVKPADVAHLKAALPQPGGVRTR